MRDSDDADFASLADVPFAGKHDQPSGGDRRGAARVRRRQTAKRVVDGLTIVTYSRPRVYLDRDAWEALPRDGVLLMHVRPTGGIRFALAFSSQELERTFGEVRDSKSWREQRCYHFPNDPLAVRAFLIGGAAS
jgi:hypothetical protein